MQHVAPPTFEDAAAALAAASGARRAVRIRGAGTKLHWGLPAPGPDVVLDMRGLDQVLEHNAGDFTAVVQAGVPLARAQALFATEGQMLALDPPLGRGDSDEATVGGIVATADSGPLRHRYGAPRDLVVGITVALSDGTIARSGGKVIKNVAGYDLAKLFAGSFGTLGAILAVAVRLHPRPPATVTAVGTASDPSILAAAAIAAARAPLELQSLDVSWADSHGAVLARIAGAETTRRGGRAVAVLREAGLAGVEIVREDDDLWARQRAGQRAADGMGIVRVAARPTELAGVVRAAEKCGASLVGRAALGVSYVRLSPDAALPLLRSLPAGTFTVVLDAPAARRTELDPWGAEDCAFTELMRRIKARFDPANACNPGVFVGGI